MRRKSLSFDPNPRCSYCGKPKTDEERTKSAIDPLNYYHCAEEKKAYDDQEKAYEEYMKEKEAKAEVEEEARGAGQTTLF